MAKLFIPSACCPVCSHANDSDFLFCQRCGYRRRVLISATTKLPSVDLASINKRLQQLLNFDRRPAIPSGKIHCRRNWKHFCPLYQGAFLWPLCVVSLYSRTKMAGLRFTVTVVNVLFKVVNILVVAHFGCHIILSIHILGS